MSAGHQPHASGDPVDRALARAHGVLPDQGPIGVFIHHNTLHAFQHLPFHQAVQLGADQLGARPYLSLREFRALIHSGRIAEADLRHEIAAVLGERAAALVLPGLSTGDLWHALTVSDADTDDATGLEFTVHTGIAR
ncbi:MAG TPA: putative inorganic carbon transporter subunit DabA, partial [Vicinamibacterales bacterium]